MMGARLALPLISFFRNSLLKRPLKSFAKLIRLNLAGLLNDLKSPSLKTMWKEIKYEYPEEFVLLLSDTHGIAET